MKTGLPYDFKNEALHERRERVFLVLAGTFLAAMTLLNVIGITRFIEIGPLALAVGVLPYPLTFLCTDLISELYGKKRASFVVWLGLGINLFVLAVLWAGHRLPAVSPDKQPPWQVLSLAQPVPLPNGEVLEGSIEFFQLIYACTTGAVAASMVAYLLAQLCDVHLYHFWKKVTRGKHLWLRNNGSTMVSQWVDSFTVISITFGAAFFRGEMTLETVLILMGGNYLFKFSAAAIDTLPFYILVQKLSHYLEIETPLRKSQ